MRAVEPLFLVHGGWWASLGLSSVPAMGALERVDQMTRAFQVGQLVHAGAILGLYDVLDRGAMDLGGRRRRDIC